MGGLGERSKRDSWGDGGGEAERAERNGTEIWIVASLLKRNQKTRKAERRCSVTKGREELTPTKKRMIKCSLKLAITFTAGWRDRQSHIYTHDQSKGKEKGETVSLL